jgi:cytochrome c
LARIAVLFILVTILTGCYQAQVKGPVAGASIVITELNADEPNVAEPNVTEIVAATSWDVAFLSTLFGEDAYADLEPFSRFVLLGVFLADKQGFDGDSYYLATASGGEDHDVNLDSLADTVATPVTNDWHAIVPGRDLQVAGAKVSSLTEVVYQYLSLRIDNLPAADLTRMLDLLARRLVGDVNEDGGVNYVDLLNWSQLFDADQLQVDASLLEEFADAILNGENAATMRQLADAVIESGAPRDGEMVYRFTQPNGNSFTCASCHAISEPALNGLRRAGHPLLAASRRPHYKNGQLSSLLEASNSCLDEWMNADSWTESSSDWLALSSWLEAQAPPGDAVAVDIQITPPPTNLGGGDAVTGRATFNQSCAICHAPDGVGSIQAPPVAGFALSPTLVANRVRLSGRANSQVYPGLTGGVMPFWGANRLSDPELLDIVAYLAEGGDDGGGAGGGGGEGGEACAADHPKVGQSTQLITRAHGVRGTATIVDNCTIELTSFNYDGRGIVVQAYTGRDGSFFGPGVYAIGPDLVGPPFQNSTLRFTLPTTASLDDFNSFSIWCIAVGVSFGDGIFN